MLFEHGETGSLGLAPRLAAHIEAVGEFRLKTETKCLDLRMKCNEFSSNLTLGSDLV